MVFRQEVVQIVTKAWLAESFFELLKLRAHTFDDGAFGIKEAQNYIITDDCTADFRVLCYGLRGV